MLAILENWRQFTVPVGILLAAAITALIANYVLLKIFRRLTRAVAFIPEGAMNKHFARPLRWVLLFVAILFALPLQSLSDDMTSTLAHFIALVLIDLVSWLLIAVVYLLDDCVIAGFDIEEKDNLRARKIHTQLRVVKRIAIVIVAVLALGTMLMTFPRVRQLGTAVLASAGIVGIVIGMAAQRTIGTFIAGLQIAFTQPIRVDDVVIVENEWGRIEEITLTYVVVRIWDLRRLIVPITYFIEKPFQNWTRVTADILGTVFIYVDHTVPLDAVRQQLQKILNDSKLWNRKVCVLQVTNTTERTVELRALMSAADASKAWDLRCHVREKLVEFIQKNYPNALPKLRAEFDKQKS
jgi:small-conductance mechanosensitive channel